MDYLSLCLICKDENDYLPEWLNYHILMGVERFYIYDNDSQSSLRETLKEYIERGWVVVVDIPGKNRQLYAYDHCLQTFGSNTFWLGFIDTDEFLVPKTTLDLKELLKDYESYGGLAVSSLFFGSNGHKVRPTAGQIAAYTKHTHITFKDFYLVKCIVQPGLVLMPNSPHDFTFKENSWCVNEDFLRVDGQRFPTHTNKIQLNHYYCRSEEEVDLKLRRGNGQDVVWSRRRFDLVNQLSVHEDKSILQNLDNLFRDTNADAGHLTERMTYQMRTLDSQKMEIASPREVVDFRPELASMEALKDQTQAALLRQDYNEVRRLVSIRLNITPQNLFLYVDLAVCLIYIGDPQSAWQSLSRAWQLSPNNNYVLLGGMAFYFLRVEDFSMAEKTCRLLLEISPHDVVALGQLAYSLLGLGRYEEALKVGVPVIELSALLDELPKGMAIFLIKKMADYLMEKKDYPGAIRLWEAGVKCQPENVTVLLELSQSLLFSGDKAGARKRLAEARSLSSQHEGVGVMNKLIEDAP